MRKCPFCAREIPSAARLCLHCGRDLAASAPKVRPAPRTQRRAAVYLVLGCALLLVLVAVVIAALRFGAARSTRPVITLTTPEPGPAGKPSSAAKNKRLFLEDQPGDAAARELLFTQVVRSTGERCDGVEKVMMRAPGNWIITCKPGHVYTFRFDAQGELKEARKMN